MGFNFYQEATLAFLRNRAIQIHLDPALPLSHVAMNIENNTHLSKILIIACPDYIERNIKNCTLKSPSSVFPPTLVIEIECFWRCKCQNYIRHLSDTSLSLFYKNKHINENDSIALECCLITAFKACFQFFYIESFKNVLRIICFFKKIVFPFSSHFLLLFLYCLDFGKKIWS